jgi:hypothetical protein
MQKEIEMDTRTMGPRVDEYDDGTIRLRPRQAAYWRGMRIRLLGVGWVGQKTLYDAAGKRLSRVPAAVRKHAVFSRRQLPAIVGRKADVWVFLELTGRVTGHLGLSTHTSVPNACRTIGEPAGRKQVVCSLATVPPGSESWLSLSGVVVGEVVTDDAQSERFEFDLAKDSVATSRPGWGALYLFKARQGKDKGTCELSVAHSGLTVEYDWSVSALDTKGREIKPRSLASGGSRADCGHLRGMTLQFPIRPREVAGIVFRPRRRVRITWGRVPLPPRPAG